MATRNTSLNDRDSVAGWTFVRNRQLTSVEEGSRATLKYLQRTMERETGFRSSSVPWTHSYRLTLPAQERNTGRRGVRYLRQAWLPQWARPGSVTRRLGPYPARAACARAPACHAPLATAQAVTGKWRGQHLRTESSVPPACVQPTPKEVISEPTGDFVPRVLLLSV